MGQGYPYSKLLEMQKAKEEKKKEKKETPKKSQLAE
tara:strand:- start:9518 stop:9625 length:108 start_codon:yes stop_codon:yes gene_type:complete